MCPSASARCIFQLDVPTLEFFSKEQEASHFYSMLLNCSYKSAFAMKVVQEADMGV